jgi:hypothetical protein
MVNGLSMRTVTGCCVSLQVVWLEYEKGIVAVSVGRFCGLNMGTGTGYCILMKVM